MNNELMLDVGQANELKMAFRRSGWTNSEIKELCERETLFQVRRVISGQAKIVPIKPIQANGEVVDTIVRVDRSIRPAYPVDRVQAAMHPELENTGPTEFDLWDVEEWLHPDQKRGMVRGEFLYQYLKDNDMLKSCLSFQDGVEIQKKGTDIFLTLFRGKTVCLWKSVVQCYGVSLRVPCLSSQVGSAVNMYWLSLVGDNFEYFNPALRFKK